ncbi:uncharacterized protein [Triticum aestivum]|uniref:uncharacterized protein n=1 Tax=Triticum aestivum TaxID=4565 RepID=UPI001D027748|nr:uncharacterized protein LOC123171561 [Triticum aestivum]
MVWNACAVALLWRRPAAATSSRDEGAQIWVARFCPNPPVPLLPPSRPPPVVAAGRVSTRAAALAPAIPGGGCCGPAWRRRGARGCCRLLAALPAVALTSAALHNEYEDESGPHECGSHYQKEWVVAAEHSSEKVLVEQQLEQQAQMELEADRHHEGESPQHEAQKAPQK